MRYGTGDWLKVVYGAGFELVRREAGSEPTEIRVRVVPGLTDLPPGEAKRFRVTVSPSEPGLAWRLYLRDFGRGPGQARSRRVWWRAFPGTWQPLGGTRQRVAEGRGRVRVDVTVRVEDRGGGASPRLRFVAESD